MTMSIKKYTAQSVMGEDFRTECTVDGDHVLILDQPLPMGNDEGANPLSYQLVALAGCISSISRIVANQKRLPLKGIRVSVEAEIDTDFLLGRTTNGRAGFTSISAKVEVEAEMTREEKQAFLDEVDRRCPISDVLMTGTRVAVSLA
ncbi:MAG: OsmC family protein [Candidatus Fermentibacter sp.]|nr:OsmC family protein [Candidatus Fermentibacter sp.]MCC6872199.1 OsmC family protein [Candidatus Fermentibacter sp.]